MYSDSEDSNSRAHENGYDITGLYYDRDDLEDDFSHNYISSRPYCLPDDINDNNIGSVLTRLGLRTDPRVEQERREQEKHEENLRKEGIKNWKKQNKEDFEKLKKLSYEDHINSHNAIENEVKECYPDIFKGRRDRSMEELFDYVSKSLSDNKEVSLFLQYTNPGDDEIDKDYGWIPDNLFKCFCKCYKCCGKFIYHEKTLEKYSKQEKIYREKQRKLNEERRKRKEEERKRKEERRKLKAEKLKVQKEKEEKEKAIREKELVKKITELRSTIIELKDSDNEISTELIGNLHELKKNYKNEIGRYWYSEDDNYEFEDWLFEKEMEYNLSKNEANREKEEDERKEKERKKHDEKSDIRDKCLNSIRKRMVKKKQENLERYGEIMQTSLNSSSSSTLVDSEEERKKEEKRKEEERKERLEMGLKWKEMRSKENRIYWFNNESGKSSWWKPYWSITHKRYYTVNDKNESKWII